LTHRVYVLNHSTNSVTVIDGLTNTVQATIAMGPGPSGGGIAVNVSTNRIYAANHEQHTITVINGATNAIIATVPGVGFKPVGVAVNESTDRIYVVSGWDATVKVIQRTAVPESHAVIATISVGSYGNQHPNMVAVNPALNRVYVTGVNSNSLYVIDGANNTLLQTVILPGAATFPNWVASDAGAGRVYVTRIGADDVVFINDADNSVLGTHPVGDGPQGIALMPGRLYIALQNEGKVAIVTR
jgi:YVTN family beta-propeller protein